MSTRACSSRGTSAVIRNEKGVTLFELLVTISVGSVVIAMLMSILSTTLVSKNFMDHENRLLQESYNISEYLQAEIFDLGVRTAEKLEVEDEDEHQILQLNHEYDIVVDPETGSVRRDYSASDSYILHLDFTEGTIHYGNSDDFIYDYQNPQFEDRQGTQLNTDDVRIEPNSDIRLDCIAQDRFQGEMKCYSAIIRLDLELNYIIQDKPLFNAKQFTTTLVF